jgi:hypothetical protein
MTKLSASLFFCILILSGCTIEKRKYSNGFHTTWNLQKYVPKKTTATNFKSEKSSSLSIPGSSLQMNDLHDDNSIDSIQKNKFTVFTPRNKNSKTKKKQLSISNTDTVPEKKNTSQAEIKPVEKYNQEEKDTRRLVFSWSTLLLSIAAFFGSVVILAGSGNSIGLVLLGLGVVGAATSIILIITFTISKNKHVKQSELYYKKKNKDLTNFNTPQDTEVLAARLAELNKQIKKHNIIRLISLPPIVLTVTYYFPIGLICLIVFIVHSIKCKKLRVKRNRLMNNDARTTPPPAYVIPDKKSLQSKLDKIARRIKINKIFLALSSLTILILALEASTAAISAIPAIILILLISILIQIILGIKKAKIKDELNLIQ